MTKNIMIVGVGGQGTLLASRILGSVLLSRGYDVKVSEVHGMSQRGGSVVTYVRYGEKVYSPVVCEGEADLILAFEQLEFIGVEPAVREIYYPKKANRDQMARQLFRKEKTNVCQGTYMIDLVREQWRDDDERLQRIIHE